MQEHSGLKLICVGGQKCGTDWLFDQLGAHADFWRPPFKEIGYFDRGFRDLQRRRVQERLEALLAKQQAGLANLESSIGFLRRLLDVRPDPRKGDFSWYLGLFENKSGYVVDCTPGYARLKPVLVKKIYKNIGEDVRVILLLRDPTERLWSQARMRARFSGKDDVLRSFDVFRAFCNERFVEDMTFLSRTYERWDSIDENGRFAVADFEDIKHRPQQLREKIASFLDVDPRAFSLEPNFNKKQTVGKSVEIPGEFRGFLNRLLSEETEKTTRILSGARNILGKH